MEPIADAMQQLANHLAEEPVPSAASMWWRITLRMRRERARRAEQPLIWMTRISIAVAVVITALLAASIPIPSHPAVGIGLLALGALIVPVAITLWSWSRSKI